jgi:hypothetical protein
VLRERGTCFDARRVGYDYSIVFSEAAAFARGFHHDSPTSPWRAKPVRHVYDLLPLIPDVVSSLHPGVDLEDLAEDIQEIGYPT